VRAFLSQKQAGGNCPPGYAFAGQEFWTYLYQKELVMFSSRSLTVIFLSTLLIALWLVWEQLEAVAIGERSYLLLYVTVAFATSALALVAYSMASRMDSRPFLPFAIILGIVSIPLGVMFLSQGRYSHVLAVLALAALPPIMQVLHSRAMRQDSYAAMFRQVKHNGIRVSRFWVDVLRRSQVELYWAIDGQDYQRIRYGEEPGMSGKLSPCSHCAAAPGQYHALTCEVERCPNCQAERFCCDCDCRNCTLQFDVQP
jgi:hypothetical protein